MDKKVSVIVPVYNIEKYIERCVRSLFIQTYKNLEIILIDDGSTDNSSEVCDRLKEVDNRVVCIHKENGGAASARNCGLNRASGDYVLFVDGDDFVHPDMIQVMYEKIEHYGVKMVICDYQHFTIENEIVEPVIGADEKVGGSDILQLLYLSERARFISPCCKLVERGLWEGIRFPERRYREDEFTIYKLLLKVNDALCISQKFYYYFQRQESLMHSFSIKQETDYYDALVERHDYLKRIGCSKTQICRDSEFCVKQIYNFIFMPWTKDGKFRTYKNVYAKIYDLYCNENGKRIKGIRYHAARYMPKLLYILWKVKKRTGKLVLEK